MTIYVKGVRRDKKLTVTYGYTNGVRLNKIITIDTLRRDHEKGYEVIGWNFSYSAEGTDGNRYDLR